MNLIRNIITLTVLSALSACAEQSASKQPTAKQAPRAQNSCTITADSIGGITLGQTLAQVQSRFLQAELTPFSDAEGAEFTQITLNPKINDDAENIIVLAHTDETTGKIEYLETDSPKCHTANGIHPKMSLYEAEQRLGKLKHITMTEIEMRQFAEFTHQPQWLTMRVSDGDFGVLQEQDLVFPLYTQRFNSNAKIISLAVARW